MAEPFLFGSALQLAADGTTELYTTVVFRKDLDFFVLGCPGEGVPTLDLPALLAAAEQPLPNGERPAPGEKGGAPLPVDPVQAFPEFRPAVHTEWTSSASASDAPPPYAKFGSLIHYADPVLRKQAKASIASEVRVLEQLRKYRMENGPDPRADHIVKYHGAWTWKGRILALILDRLPNVLSGRCRESPLRPLNIDKVVRGVRAALNYLHERGLCHNDVCPPNVGLTANDEAVLIDFDACLPPGAPLTKGGATKRLNPAATTSCEENDERCVQALETELRRTFRAVEPAAPSA